MTQTYDFDEMNRNVIREFRASGGTAGGVFAGMPLVLVHHTGAKTGIERIAPLVALLSEDRIFVFASKGGSDDNPHWYNNLVAHPEVTVELGTETFPATARVLTGDERDAIYAQQSTLQPQFAEHQRNTTRVIPVIELVKSAAQ
ncbi:cell entry protein [Mycobacterium sp. Root265]|uniref:nitroreductase family deazaflavin-dependent oxidoreductase n=1 Tax=Mycobacterium sp. Root265 TaxID=1736504 RepID=UPI000709211B|nr:nitroreductase family deazaflavin-dependent oxidoreductase [Mycobacterium sp. Root265]KRD06997.1 cell entry protein [Mycobacterium sp. Root265]